MPAKAESRTARLSLMIPGPSTCSLAGVSRFSLCRRKSAPTPTMPVASLILKQKSRAPGDCLNVAAVIDRLRTNACRHVGALGSELVWILLSGAPLRCAAIAPDDAGAHGPLPRAREHDLALCFADSGLAGRPPPALTLSRTQGPACSLALTIMAGVRSRPVEAAFAQQSLRACAIVLGSLCPIRKRGFNTCALPT